MPIFYVVATPIGNLEDITQRAIKVLKEVDIILCENFRVARKLLFSFNIQKPIIRYCQHSGFLTEKKILKAIEEGKKIALISDAGTPGISDPGGMLISKIIEKFGDQIKIIPIPGPSAITTAASISGFWMDKFLFLGFLPKKKKRKKIFEEISESEYPVIFYESPHRILKTLSELKEVFQKMNQEERRIVACRELTKKFETIYRGNIQEIIEKIQKDKIKGEFVIIVDRKIKNKKTNYER